MKTNDLMPEIYLFEILKSHSLRNYLERDGKIENIPFGTAAILNNKELLITSHFLIKKHPMIKTILY